MLKTLDNYIETGTESDSAFASLWNRVRLDRRFDVLLVSSLIAHLIFYAAILWINYWEMREIKPEKKTSTTYVEITEIMPLPQGYDLRPAPESLERADINHLQYDPANPDDTHLLSRSPNPTTERGSGGQIPSAEEIEQHLKASRGTESANSGAAPSAQLPSAGTVPAPLDSLPQAAPPVSTQLPNTQNSSAPPAPSLNGTSSTSNAQPASAGARRGNSIETALFGLEQAKSQYMAYVRAKISKENERIMPRRLIEELLSDKISADFEIEIGRDGRLLSARLVRSSGYSQLDSVARQAIFISSPFEGYPQNAGDKIPLRVTVYYTPYR
ncbi:MAG TPA: TonB C-terminal domain-containing protein [Blastocatellia bacterium]|nr:TonB C-terminal domain-containing protein [Blastocatellia bacterium]